MDWFYANDGQQSGPVSPAQLDELARTGVVQPETLVWRDGLPQWMPYRDTRPPAPPPAASIAAPPVIAQPTCVECQRSFAPDELLRYENMAVCAACKPIFFQKVREGLVPGAFSVWRQENLLVMRKKSPLPDRCVKCNAPASGRKLTRKLFWHSPYYYLLIPAGLLVYAIVATIIGKKAKIEIGFCGIHHRIRVRDLCIAWLLCLASLGGLILSFAIANVNLGMVSVALLLASGLYGVLRLQPVTPKRIDDEFIWLKGVSPEYLGTLPLFPGR